MDVPAIRVADPNAWLELQARGGAAYEAYPATARFGRRGLTGAWNLDLFDPPGFADELEALYGSLKGQATLSDSEGFGMTITVDSIGHVKAVIRIEGWPFHVDGWIEFACDIDQTYLPDLWRSVRSAFPLAAKAQRRIGEPLQ